MSPNITAISPREQALITALTAIMAETMDYPVSPPLDSDSYLPDELFAPGVAALALYGVVLPSYKQDAVDDEEAQKDADPVLPAHPVDVRPPCILCDHYVTDFELFTPICINPAVGISADTGKPIRKPCCVERHPDLGTFCGPKGHGFSPLSNTAQRRNAAGFARLELINWLAAAALLLLPAFAYLLDGPSELDAAQDVAADVADAQAAARAVALAQVKLTPTQRQGGQP